MENIPSSSATARKHSTYVDAPIPLLIAQLYDLELRVASGKKKPQSKHLMSELIKKSGSQAPKESFKEAQEKAIQAAEARKKLLAERKNKEN